MVEGAPLLREYTGDGIEGSNPFLSATFSISRQFASRTPDRAGEGPGRSRALRLQRVR